MMGNGGSGRGSGYQGSRRGRDDDPDVVLTTKPERKESYRLGPAVSRRAVAVELALDALDGQGSHGWSIAELLRTADEIERYLWAGLGERGN